MAEAAEGLGIKHPFRHAVEMPGHRHAAPADAEGRMDVGLGPVHHLDELVPVGHLLEGQMLDRGAGDDQPVELLGLDRLERPVELGQVLGGGIAGLVRAHPDQRQVDLQGRRADQPGELVLGLDLLRHQVQKPDPQGPDILMRGAVGRHHHDAFAREDLIGGQIAG